MNQDIVILLAGLLFTIIGALGLFSKKFFNWVRHNLWKQSETTEGTIRFARFQALTNLIIGIFILLTWLFR